MAAGKAALFAAACCLAGRALRVEHGGSSALLLDAETGTSVAVEGSDVRLIEFWGRAGNNLIQVANALIYAEHTGKRRFVFPTIGAKDFWSIFQQPHDNTVLITDHQKSKCVKEDDGHFYDDLFKPLPGCIADVSERRRVLLKYIKPMMKKPQDEFKTSEDELLIHIRGGDIMKDNMKQHPQSHQPPCAFYDYVIENGNNGQPFKNVRIVTSPDHLNPCPEEVAKRHENVVVQRRNKVDDLAAIVNAKHLVMSTSSFSINFGMLNDNLDTAFVAKESGLGEKVLPCRSGYAKKMVFIKTPGWEKLNNVNFMRTYNKQKLQVAETC